MPDHPPKTKTLWSKIRRAWVICGTIATIGFAAWCLLAYRASDLARQASQSDGEVKVNRGDNFWSFAPVKTSASPAVGLLFFPGSMVEPAAYAPLARAVALKGYTVLLVELPRRGSFGGATGTEITSRARAAMQQRPDVPRWVIAGHSLGGAVAARFVHEDPKGVAGLVLIGTSHPREFSLADLKIPVTKILGTRDGVAAVEKSDATRKNLPASTRRIIIEGGNHSQFGCYGFQPGDHFAKISREDQQKQTIEGVLEMLKQAAADRH